MEPRYSMGLVDHEGVQDSVVYLRHLEELQVQRRQYKPSSQRRGQAGPGNVVQPEDRVGFYQRSQRGALAEKLGPSQVPDHAAQVIIQILVEIAEGRKGIMTSALLVVRTLECLLKLVQLAVTEPGKRPRGNIDCI